MARVTYNSGLAMFEKDAKLQTDYHLLLNLFETGPDSTSQFDEENIVSYPLSILLFPTLWPSP